MQRSTIVIVVLPVVVINLIVMGLAVGVPLWQWGWLTGSFR